MLTMRDQIAVEWSKQEYRSTALLMYRCKKCKKAERVEYARHTVSTHRSDMIRAVHSITTYTRDGREYRNPELRECCGRPMEYQAIRGVLSTEHVCDARCLAAKGCNCECSCGGANHGKDHAV